MLEKFKPFDSEFHDCNCDNPVINAPETYLEREKLLVKCCIYCAIGCVLFYGLNAIPSSELRGITMVSSRVQELKSLAPRRPF